jgi:hypothetical protein
MNPIATSTPKVTGVSDWKKRCAQNLEQRAQLMAKQSRLTQSEFTDEMEALLDTKAELLENRPDSVTEKQAEHRLRISQPHIDKWVNSNQLHSIKWIKANRLKKFAHIFRSTFTILTEVFG